MVQQFGATVLPHQRRPVAWYAPSVLWLAGNELVSSQDFQRNLDRREGFDGDLIVNDFSAAADAGGRFGFDFISDTGDGGNATFTVAEGALRDRLHTDDGRSFERPDLVVLGGDLAYPAASSTDYHFRFLEVFELARRSAGVQQAWADVLAIPQNHDWLDSATTFSRYFVGRVGEKEFVNARSLQERTYFAAALPHRWWLLGLDFAHGGDIDRKQYEAFCALWDPARPQRLRIAEGDNVILLYPQPTWTEPLAHGTPAGYTRRFQRLEHAIEGAVGNGGAGARVRLRLAGDLHHYACWRAEPPPAAGGPPKAAALVTCGAGGAFMHTTHGREVQGSIVLDHSPAADTVPADLGRRVRVGLKDDSCGPPEQVTPFRLTCVYPGVWRSRWLAATRLPWSMFRVRFGRIGGPGDLVQQLWDSNLGFALLLGVLYGINSMVNSIPFSRSNMPDGYAPLHELPVDFELLKLWVRAMFASPFAALINAGMIAGCVRLGWEGTWPSWLRAGVAVLHALLHGFAILVLTIAAAHFAHGELELDGSPILAACTIWLLVCAAGVLCGGLLFGGYFALLNVVFGQLTNNASGAFAGQDHKGFLRFEIGPDGLLMRMLGCDRVPRRWRLGLQGRHEPAGDGTRWRVVDELTLRR